MKLLLSSLSGKEFVRQGEGAARLLPRIPGWDAYASVLLFRSMKGEIDTGPLEKAIGAAGKPLFFPSLRAAEGGNSADMDFYRSPAPDRPPAETPPLRGGDFPALILCPGLAFDRRGRRLGRGRGCYDRFFAALDSGRLGGSSGGTGPLPYSVFGLCLSRQLVEAVPVEDHDKIMDGVLTGSGLIRVRRRHGRIGGGLLKGD
jgi:5-formyltetrahydrofolate cyclo-ligase